MTAQQFSFISLYLSLSLSHTHTLFLFHIKDDSFIKLHFTKEEIYEFQLISKLGRVVNSIFSL